MKKTLLLLLIFVALFVCVLVFPEPKQLVLNEKSFSQSTVPPADQAVSVASAGTAEPATNLGRPEGELTSRQEWIEARPASIAIVEAPDPATDEPVGTIHLGGASGSLGETPPFYRLQLKTAKHPILLGEKDTRYHFVRRVDGVRVAGDGIVLMPEIAVSYPRTASPGGIVFPAHEDQISRLGVIVPEVDVPAGDDPSATEWTTVIRVGTETLGAELPANAALQPLGADTVLVMQTRPGAALEKARVLWFFMDANGSFVVDHP